MYRRYFIGTGIFLLFLFLSATPLTIVKSYDEGCLGEFCLPNDLPAQPQPQPLQPSPSQINQYQPLVNLPGLTSGTRTLTDYVNVLFRLAIGIGALIAVIRLVLAGIKYMGDDAFSSKAEAKKDIQAVLVGLLIMLSTYVILNTIWPGILRLDLLKLDPIQVRRMVPATPTEPTLPAPPLPPLQDNARQIGQETQVTARSLSDFNQKIDSFRRECDRQGGMINANPNPNLFRGRRDLSVNMTFNVRCEGPAS